VTGTAKIEVPMKYEDVYVNGKKLGSKDGLERYIFYEGLESPKTRRK
jgi:hypothetical protein